MVPTLRDLDSRSLREPEGSVKETVKLSNKIAFPTYARYSIIAGGATTFMKYASSSSAAALFLLAPILENVSPLDLEIGDYLIRWIWGR